MLYLILFCISSFGTQLFKQYALKVGLLDVPNERSSHQVATVRGGGIVFVLFGAAWVIGAYYVGLLAPLHFLALIPSLLIAGVGFWDDHQSLSALKRMVCHFLAASLVLFLYGVSSPILWVILLGIFLWSTNLFNFMDGIDGLASIEAIFVLGVGGWLLKEVGATDLSQWAFCLVALIAGFLRWNWPKAALFMGDIGSGFLGFMIATFAVIGYLEYQLSLFYWVILYGTFWFDASITLVRRLYLRQPIFSAHKLHAYQRLYQSGVSQKKILWGAIVLNSVLAILAVFAYYHSEYLPSSVIVAVSLLTVVALAVERRLPLQG